METIEKIKLETEQPILVKVKTEKELQRAAEGIMYFLSKVHPTMTNEEDRNACVGILPIQRFLEDSQTKYNYSLNKPFVLWRWTPETKEMLLNFLRKLNGQPVDLYYGVSNFDYDKETYTKEGKLAIKGIVNSQNARYSKEIMLDFDNCNEEEFIKYRDMLNNIGLEAMWVFTGHGYQAHILLSEKNYNENNYNIRIVYAARSRGFDVDEACVDIARKSRLPQWNNYKCYEKEKYAHERTNPPKTKGKQDTDKRYTLAEVMEKLESLPIVDKDELDKLEELEKKISLSDNQNHNNKEIKYDKVDITNYPKAIQKMLTQPCNKGYRNDVLKCLIHWLKRKEKLSKEVSFETLRNWNEYTCVPHISNFKNEFDRIWAFGGFTISNKLVKVYGKINYKNIDILKLDREISIFNTFIKEEMKDIKGSGMNVYLAIKMAEHLGKEPTKSTLVELTGLSLATIERGIKDLGSKHIYKVKSNKKDGEKYCYHTHKIGDIDSGYLILSYNDLKCMAIELKTNAIKLYIYMLSKNFKNKYCTINQKDLGVAIGVKQNTITGLIQQLEKKDYIQVEKKAKNKVIDSCAYTLKR